MEKFLAEHDASLASQIFASLLKIQKALKSIYAPINEAFEFVLQETNLSLEELTSSPIFEALIQNHVNSEDKFPVTYDDDGYSYIDGIEIIASTTIVINRKKVSIYVISGVLATQAQVDQLLDNRVFSTINSTKNSSTMTEDHLERIRALKTIGPETISARGWHEISPKKGIERKLLKEKCGDACFLRPEDNGYPICPKLSETNDTCKVDCRALASTKTRARFLPPEYSKKIIPQLQDDFHCHGK